MINLTVTRPDLAYAVQVLAQFLATPRRDHLVAAHRVVRYIKNALGQGLFMSSSFTLTLNAYCDSDWGGCQETRHSLTGYCVMFGSFLISWHCKKQPTVSKSLVEAEYRSMADTTCELVRLLSLFKTFVINFSYSYYCSL